MLRGITSWLVLREYRTHRSEYRIQLIRPQIHYGWLPATKQRIGVKQALSMHIVGRP